MLKFRLIYNEVVDRIGHDRSTSNEELERVGIQTMGDKFLGVFVRKKLKKMQKFEFGCSFFVR